VAQAIEHLKTGSPNFKSQFHQKKKEKTQKTKPVSLLCALESLSKWV
jgi:hypothetical protein